MTFEEFIGILVFGFPYMVFIVLMPMWIFYELIVRRIKKSI